MMHSDVNSSRVFRMPGWRTTWILALMLGAGPVAAVTAGDLVGRGKCATPETRCVTVHKGAILRMRPQRPAKIVLVADPEIADVVIESPLLIFILGRQPGVTNLFVLDEKEREIHNLDIVVRPNEEDPVSVHRGTKETTLNCAPRCHVVATPGAAAGSTVQRGAAARAGPGEPAPGAAQGGELIDGSLGPEAQPATN